MSFIEENEISKNSNGGTELTKRLIGDVIPEDLAQHFQIVPSRIRDLKEDKIRIYWAHDLAEDPECAKFADQSFRDKFHKMVFVSNYQMMGFVKRFNIPMDDKLRVIENPIVPFEPVEKSKDKIKLIYFSTPQRGLQLLVPVFETLCQKHKDIHLDVFSSFKIYGWEEADKQFEPLYDEIRNHPNMTYHGYADQDTLRKHIQQANILAYPCVWEETSCRVLIESMSAGVFCVHPNLGALPETSGGLTMMYQYDQDVKEHANMFYRYLDNAIESYKNDPQVDSYLKFVKAYADMRFNLPNISNQWKTLLENLLNKYPNEESRKFSKGEMFVYKA